MKRKSNVAVLFTNRICKVTVYVVKTPCGVVMACMN